MASGQQSRLHEAGTRKDARRSPGSGDVLCPSAQPDMQGSVVFGVIGGTVDRPQVRYLTEPQPVTDDILAMSGPMQPTEVFRFAAPCAGSACQHFDGSNCQLVSRAVKSLPESSVELPFCRLRSACRWWQEQGRRACVRCSGIVTRVERPTAAMKRTAGPNARIEDGLRD